MNLTEAKTFGLDGFRPKTDGVVASLWVFAALLENVRGGDLNLHLRGRSLIQAIGWPDAPSLPVQLSSR